MHQQLKELLEKLRREAPGNVFTGAGIVVYDSLENLPIVHMGENSGVNGDDLFTTILKSSLATNPHHDGFSLISSKFNLTHKNVYIAPPISETVSFDKEKGYGTRYVAALMGSKVEGIMFTAIVSNSYGIVIFKNGIALDKTSND